MSALPTGILSAFLVLSVTPRRFLFLDILDFDFCVQSLWGNSTFLQTSSCLTNGHSLWIDELLSNMPAHSEKTEMLQHI